MHPVKTALYKHTLQQVHKGIEATTVIAEYYIHTILLAAQEQEIFLLEALDQFVNFV